MKLLVTLALLAASAFTANAASPRQMDAAAIAARDAHKPVVVPTVKKHLYPEVGEAQKDIDAAFVLARKEHKRVILDFGGDWCGDCQVLDIYFHQAPNEDLLTKNYVKVNVNIGHIDQNVDIAKKYGVDLHGVPALSVLSPTGTVIFAQHNEFSDMRYMQPQSVTDFLTKYKK